MDDRAWGWSSGQGALRTRHRKVDGSRDHVAQFPDVERAFVRNDGLVFTNSEPDRGHILAWGYRVIAESINAPVYPTDRAAPGMVGEERWAIAVRLRLIDSEVALLLARHVIEADAVGRLLAFRRVFD